jgi:hypothetical protein
MPRDFGVRWLVWMAYSNMLTIVFTAQLVMMQVAYDPHNAQSPWVHWVLTGANVFGIIGAQIKRNKPPPPAPRKRK